MTFVGRRRETAQTRRLVEAHRLVTLTGPGGVGKTRLATRVAHDLRRAFPHGVHLIDLSRLDNHLLLADTVLQALNVMDHSSRPAVEVLSEYLADRRMLLVVDNCEHLIDACGWLVGALLRAAPSVRVLATSRETLRVPGESVLEVTPLATTEALELFEQRARAVRLRFAVTDDNRDAVAQLCRRLDHLPLAIELAAAQLRALSVTEILDRIDDRFTVLTTPGRAGERQASLRALIEWSAQTCSKPERLLWARASVFAGDFALDAAEWVCADDEVAPDEILDLIAGLVDKSILVGHRGGPDVRYGWLDTMREYGQLLLAEPADTAALRARHRDWCLSMTDPMWSIPCDARQFGAAMARLLAERANLRAALDHCLSDAGPGHIALELAGRLAFFWLASGTLSEGRHWLERALAADPRPSPQRARALWAYGWLAIEQGEPDAAGRRLAEARDLAARVGDESAMAWTVALTGYAAFFTGELSRARTLLEDGLARHRSQQNTLGVLATLSGLAQTTSYLGDPISETISQDAIDLADRDGWAAAGTTAARNLGLELVRQGHPHQAVKVLREALRGLRGINQRYGTATFLELLAWAAEADRQHERAARLLGAAHAANHRIGATVAQPQQERGRRCAAAARRALGEQRFAAAYHAGEQLPEDQALRYALDETPGHPVPPPREPHVLTRREEQVAHLVARGCTDKDIAAELVISPRTAESHVAHILTKLGFTTRAQIAAWTTRRGG